MIGLFIEAGEAMDAAFWEQAYGDRESLLASVDEPDARAFIELNYGPWDRLDGDEPFLEGVGPKPPGANIFPQDLTKDAFDAGLTFLNQIRRDGECDDCGDEARLREIAVEGGDGGLVPASVCAECQARKMRALLEADDVG